MIDAESIKRQTNIAAVIGQWVKLQPAGPGELVGLCPFHHEKTPSLTVTPARGAYYCFGCEVGGDVFSFVQKIEGVGFREAVFRVAELSGIPCGEAETGHQHVADQSLVPDMLSAPTERATGGKSRVTATYRYVDEHGGLLYEVQRVEPGRNGRAKDFRQRRPHPIDGSWVWGITAGAYRRGQDGWYPAKGGDGDDELPEVRRVLYRLPEVLAAETVLVTEGEKDADTLAACGLAATTNSGGATQPWRQEYTEALAGRKVIVLPDQDEPGRKRGQVVAAALKGHAAEVIVLNVPSGKDVTDWFAAGGDREELERLVEQERFKRRQAEVAARGLLSPKEIVESFPDGYNAFLDPSKRKRGLQTPFQRLNDMTTGLHPGELILLAARPAMGKTALALNLAARACKDGHAVAIFSLEMSRESLLNRLVCSEALVDQLTFRHGHCTSDERRRLQGRLTDTYDWRLRIDDTPSVTVGDIERKCKLMRAEIGLDLVVIDYLQLMQAERRENRTQEVTALSRGLKLLAREFEVPVLALSQLSRAPETRGGKPQLSDLRDSGGLEQDADMVWFIFREEVYKQDRPDLTGLAELTVAKQRNGPIGPVLLTWRNRYTRFEQRTEREEREAA